MRCVVHPGDLEISDQHKIFSALPLKAAYQEGGGKGRGNCDDHGENISEGTKQRGRTDFGEGPEAK
jgi:hypothetical protein